MNCNAVITADLAVVLVLDIYVRFYNLSAIYNESFSSYYDVGCYSFAGFLWIAVLYNVGSSYDAFYAVVKL